MTAIPTRSNGQVIDASWFNTIKTKIEGNLELTATTAAVDTSASGTYNLYSLNAASNAVDLELPAIAGLDKKVYIVRASDVSNDATVSTADSSTINGSATYTFSQANEAIAVVADETNTNWIIFSTAFDSTGGGGSSLGTPDIYAVVTPTDYNIGTWDVTNLTNASFALETTSPLFSTSSYKLTNAVGADGEYILGPSITVDTGRRQKRNFQKWTYTYAGTSGAIRFHFYDVTNTKSLGYTDVVSTTAPLPIVPTGYVSSTTAEVTVEVEIITGEAFNLVFDQGQFNSNPFLEKDLLLQEEVTYESSNGLGSTDTRIRRFATLVKDTSGDLLTVANTAANGLTVTANRDCYVCVSWSDQSTANAYIGITVNSTALTTDVNSVTGTTRKALGYMPSVSVQLVSWCGELKAGDVLRPHGHSSLNASSPNCHFTVTAVSETSAVVHSSNTSLEEWTSDGTTNISAVTTAPTKGTVSSDDISYRQVGDSYEVFVTYAQSSGGGAAGSGIYLIAMPNSKKIDTTKIIADNSPISDTLGDATLLGNGFISVEGSYKAQVGVYAYDEDYLFLRIGATTNNSAISSSTGDVWSSSTAAALQFDDNVAFSFTATVPIKGLSGGYKYAITPLTETCYVKHVETSGTGGGSSSAATWNVRTLNTLEGDTSWISLSSNRFTLAPGKYEVYGMAPGYFVDYHKLALVSDPAGTPAYAIIGSGAYSYGTSTARGHSQVEIMGVLDITEPTTYELQHYTQTARATDAFGIAVNSGVDEVHAQVKITKLLWR